MFSVIVCVKAVPDPKAAGEVRIDPATRTLTRSSIPLVMNPLDRYALEAALRIKDRRGAHVAALSMGPPAAGRVVREGLALGADEGVLLSDRALAGADAYATAYTLARGVEKIGLPDLVLCGMASSDGSTEWVGPMLATFLGLPVVTMVKALVAVDGGQWQVKAAVEHGYRLVRVSLPAVLTVTRELNTPRALSFSGIVRARKKAILEWGLADLGVAEERVGLKGSPTIVSAMATRESKRQVAFITGTREEKVARLVRELTEAGVL